MSESQRKEPIIGQRFLQTAEVVQRPPAERPTHDSIHAIGEWIIGPARHGSSGVSSFDELAWRLLAAGLPLLRATFHGRTLHPQFLGANFVWWRTTGQTVQTMIAHEMEETIRSETNPVRRVALSGETLRRQLDLPDDQLDFPILHELKGAGGTDYLVLPTKSALGANYVVTFVTDRVGGFAAQEIADLTWIAQRVPIFVDLHHLHRIARNLLNAYLGSNTGPRVLAGQIRRGTGEQLNAVLWSSDLRQFTARSDRLAGDQMIAILNALFDAQAKAIQEHGGEILKFIGDGLLAIFPIDDAEMAGNAARNALVAASEAVAAVRQLVGHPSMKGEPPLDIVVGLHIGSVIYGNIGAADRLDFTVIGPAVNLVSRIETIAKALNAEIVVSDDFARAYGRPLTSLGLHQLRGLATPHELFAPITSVSRRI
jgi:adenylate cyclase